MLGRTCITRVQFKLPLVEERERRRSVADLIAKIVGDAAVRINIEEMLAQAARQKPRSDGKVLVMGAGQTGAILAGLFERRGLGWNGVTPGQAAPAQSSGSREWRVLHRELGHG